MEILRLPETTSIEAAFTMQSASTLYVLNYKDLTTGVSYSASATSNSSKIATFILNSRYLTYSGDIFANVYDSSNNLKVSMGVEIVKPYCDITSLKNKLGTTTSQTIEAERVARNIIESEAGHFQFVRKQKEFIGMGIDYLPIDEKIVKLYYMWENNQLIYDFEDSTLDQYGPSIDGTSIVLTGQDQNKVEYAKVWRDRNYEVTFSAGNDYLVEADFGYQIVPGDIEASCELLIQDLVNENLKYYNRNMLEFDNNEFKIKFNSNASSGTGNLIVDKNLSRYKNRIRPGVI